MDRATQSNAKRRNYQRNQREPIMTLEIYVVRSECRMSNDKSYSDLEFLLVSGFFYGLKLET